MRILKSIKKRLVLIDNIFFGSNVSRYFYLAYYNSKLLLIKCFKIKPLQSKRHDLDNKLIVSLTSYPLRFKTLPLVLNSILNQSIRPDKIILNIEYSDKKKIPNSVLDFKNIEIKYIKNGLKAYGKIIPSLKKYSNIYIITFDDDIIYSKKAIEYLVTKSKKNPDAVIANRIDKIKVIKNYPDRYQSWYPVYRKQTKYAFLTGVGGVLYPPNCFHKDVCNEKLFKKLSPLNDDVWLNWMVRLNSTKIIYSYPGKIYDDIKILPLGLYAKNITFTDKQVDNMIKKYGFPF